VRKRFPSGSRGDNAPDVSVLVALSRLLGVSLDWLLDAHGPDGEGGRPQEVFEATVFVADLEGFWRARLDLSERDGATWLNGRLFQITEAILRHDGIPVKYLGDAVLAFFAGTNHRDRAVRAAFLARRTTDTPVHVGLNTGQIYLGQIGHPEYARMDVLGLAVDVAFLAERWASKQTGSHVAATALVVGGLSMPAETRESSALAVSGMEPIPLYGLELPD
jgi:class 3 adenylate cyclase